MKKSIVWLCVFVFVLGISLFSGNPEDAAVKKVQKLCDKGFEALKSNKPDKAQEFYQQAIQQKADFGPAYAGLASVFNKMNKKEEAVQNFEKALQLQPDQKNAAIEFVNLLVSLSNQANQQNQVEKAYAYYAKIADIPNLETLDPKFYMQVLLNVGYYHAQQKQMEKSNAYFLKLNAMTQNQPQYVESYKNSCFGLGQNLSFMKQRDEANKYLAKFVELNKGNADPKVAEFMVMANFMIGVNNYDAMNEKLDKIKAEGVTPERKEKIAKLEADKQTILKAKVVNKQKLAKLENDIQLVNNEDVEAKKERIAAAAKEAQVEPYLLPAIQSIPRIGEEGNVRLGNYYYLCMNLEQSAKVYKTLLEKYPTSSSVSSYKQFLEGIEKEIAQNQAKNQPPKK